MNVHRDPDSANANYRKHFDIMTKKIEQPTEKPKKYLVGDTLHSSLLLMHFTLVFPLCQTSETRIPSVP